MGHVHGLDQGLRGQGGGKGLRTEGLQHVGEGVVVGREDSSAAAGCRQNVG